MRHLVRVLGVLISFAGAALAADPPKPDPLPEGAVRRLGTTDFRVGGAAVVRGFAISPDGKQLGVVSDRLQLHDAATGRLVSSAPLPPVRLAASDQEAILVPLDSSYTNGRCVWAPDGKALLVPSQGYLYRFPLPLGEQPAAKLPLPDERSGVVAALHSEGVLFALTQEGHLYEFQPKSDEWTRLDIAAVLSGRGVHLQLAGGKGVVAVAGGDGRIRLWDTAKREAMGTIRVGGEAGTVDGLHISADGRRLVSCVVSAEAKENVEVWSLPDLKRLAGWSLLFAPVPALSPDGSILAVATSQQGGVESNEVGLFDTKTGKRLQSLPVAGDTLRFLEFSRDGRDLVAAGTEGAIRRWDAKTGKTADPDTGHCGIVRAVVALKDGRVLTAGGDGVVRLWDDAGNEVRRFEGHKQAVTALAVSADGDTLFTAGLDLTVRAWGMADGKQVRQADLGKTLQDRGAYALALSPDGKTLAAGLQRSTRLFNAADLKTTGNLTGPAGPALKEWTTAATFVDDGRLATMTKYRAIRVWDVAKKAEALTINVGALGYSTPAARDEQYLALTPDGKTMAAPLYPKEFERNRLVFLAWWDSATGKEIGRVEVSHSTVLSAVAFAPDGKSVLVGDDRSGKILLVDVENKKVLKTFDAGRHRVRSLSVAPDGKTFVTGGSDTTALVWKLDAK